MQEERVVLTNTMPEPQLQIPQNSHLQLCAALRVHVPANKLFLTPRRACLRVNNTFSRQLQVLQRSPPVLTRSKRHTKYRKVHWLPRPEHLNLCNQCKIHGRRFHATTIPEVIAGTEVLARILIRMGASKWWR